MHFVTLFRSPHLDQSLNLTDFLNIFTIRMRCLHAVATKFTLNDTVRTWR